MPDLKKALSQSDSIFGITQSGRAIDAWRRINDNPETKKTIVISRYSSDLEPQIVRLEFRHNLDKVSDTNTTAVAYKVAVVVFGVRNHPGITNDDGSVTPVADTDIAINDEFEVDGSSYVVQEVLLYAGEVQALCSRMTR